MSTNGDPPRIEPTALPTPTKPISDILGRAGTESSLPVDDSAAALELRLQKETDGRNEDKFYAFAIGTVLLDMAMFPHLPVVGIPLIFILEVVILLGLAKRFGSEHVTVLLDQLYYRLCETVGKKKD